MAALLGSEVNAWLVVALLLLTVGLTGAVLAATRDPMHGARRTR